MLSGKLQSEIPPGPRTPVPERPPNLPMCFTIRGTGVVTPQIKVAVSTLSMIATQSSLIFVFSLSNVSNSMSGKYSKSIALYIGSSMSMSINNVLFGVLKSSLVPLTKYANCSIIQTDIIFPVLAGTLMIPSSPRIG
ncbi:hypothetical protein [Salmon gill poxvirus]|nr:hypothetical protein [Salmon gill poxvirus]